LGRVGEKKASDYLKKQGFKILKSNYKCPFGEIDIIAEQDGKIIFIEVKTRSSENYGLPCEAVDYKKQEKYFKMATFYLQREKKLDAECRFDVIEIKDGQINHILNAFSM
jgi:putative endonuclease